MILLAPDGGGSWGTDAIDRIDSGLTWVFQRYAVDPDHVAVVGFSAGVSVGGLIFAGALMWVGALQPDSSGSVVTEGSATTPTAGGGDTPFPNITGEVVQEQPSEARAIFSPAISAVTPWYNDLVEMMGPATLDDPEGEAVLTGTWWALSDWCADERHGSVGRCYDLAALYVLEQFDRDPRTINAKTWMNAGAIGGIVFESYEVTAFYVSLEVKSSLLPEFFEDRPGLDWECEPTCTGGYELR